MNSTLDLSEAQMRELGIRVIDQIVRHLSTLPEQRVGSKADSSVVSHCSKIPEQGSDLEPLLQYLEQCV
ncbi:MAG: hypothetical protein JO022_13795, partial [Acidobacteriaceae bacterium]|nr:hypothetical protein [Acidobacteriaceae bacterium]